MIWMTMMSLRSAEWAIVFLSWYLLNIFGMYYIYLDTISIFYYISLTLIHPQCFHIHVLISRIFRVSTLPIYVYLS